MGGLLAFDVGETTRGLGDGVSAFEEVGDRVPLAFNKAIAGGIGDAGLPCLGAGGDGQLGDVDGDFDIRIGADKGVARSEVFLGKSQARHTEGGGVAEEDLREAATDEGGEAEAPEGLGSMLAGAATAEVKADDHDALLGGGDAGSLGRVHRVRALLTVRAGTLIAEGVFAETVEGHAAEEARGDDAVGVDVIAGDSEGEGFDLIDLGEGQGGLKGVRRRRGGG